MDLLLRVAPEVRLRSTASGLRAVVVESLAPPGATDENPGGSGGEGTEGSEADHAPASSGAGEEPHRAPATHVRTATGVGARPASGGEGKHGRDPRASLDELERRARSAQAAEDIHELQVVEETLTSLHLVNHPLRRHPEPPTSTEVPVKERAMLERKAIRAAQPRIPVFKRAVRSRARALAETEADHFVRTLDLAHGLIAQHRTAVLEDQWNALADHDRCAVMAELDAEFARSECCCTCVDAGWEAAASRGYVTVVAHFPTLDVVAERGPGASSSGRGMLRRRTPSERNALYLSALASFALGTARRVISVAVAADDVHVLVVRTPEQGAGLEPVYVGTFSREAVTLRPSLADPVPLLLASAVQPLQFEGPTNDLVALAPEPAVLAVVQRCVEALEDQAEDQELEDQELEDQEGEDLLEAAAE